MTEITVVEFTTCVLEPIGVYVITVVLMDGDVLIASGVPNGMADFAVSSVVVTEEVSVVVSAERSVVPRVVV